MRVKRTLAALGPGLLVAATGVGAGDLATAAFTGAELGTAVLWAVLLGAAMKFVLNEGLTRWQLATGDTLLEGCITRMPRLLRHAFLAYFVAWSFLVAAALMSACGATFHAILPLFGDATTDKIVYGILHSAAGVAVALFGGFRLFERVMGACIAAMFLTVVVCAALLAPAAADLARGLVLPTIPDVNSGGLAWTVALMGGVGGTVTILCYGYWIREKGRLTADDLDICRIDLLSGYAMTAIFGIAMVILGSTVSVPGRGVGLIVALADRLGTELGPLGRWAFLLGAWGAVASSLLGVWQSVPYLFSDFWGLRRARKVPAERTVDTRSLPYRAYLLALATVPVFGLVRSFVVMQKAYAITGALFLPMLAAALLALNGSARRIGERHRNRPWTNAVLVAILAFFLLFLAFDLLGR